jgi:hypothetical protein
MKLTPWFPANVKPVRAGVYEVKGDPKYKWHRYWDGKDWYCGSFTPNGAVANFNEYRLRAVIKFPWRGLAEEPK